MKRLYWFDQTAGSIRWLLEAAVLFLIWTGIYYWFMQSIGFAHRVLTHNVLVPGMFYYVFAILTLIIFTPVTPEASFKWWRRILATIIFGSGTTIAALSMDPNRVQPDEPFLFVNNLSIGVGTFVGTLGYIGILFLMSDKKWAFENTRIWLYFTRFATISGALAISFVIAAFISHLFNERQPYQSPPETIETLAFMAKERSMWGQDYSRVRSLEDRARLRYEAELSAIRFVRARAPAGTRESAELAAPLTISTFKNVNEMPDLMGALNANSFGIQKKSCQSLLYFDPKWLEENRD